MKLLKPIKGNIIQRYGGYSKESEDLGYMGHTGIDFEPMDSEVKAAHDGVVTVKNGNVYILREKEVKLNGVPTLIETAYVHMGEIKDLKKVERGDVIGRTLKNKGLHFSLIAYWREGNAYKADEQNGYNGRIDPLPYFSSPMKYVKALIVLILILCSLLVSNQGLHNKDIVIDKYGTE